MAQCNGQIAEGDERLRRRDLDGAEQCYRSALDADPRSANAMQSIGFVCAQRDDHQAALTWAQRAVEAGLVFAAAASRYALGVARLMEHRPDDAIAALDEAV